MIKAVIFDFDGVLVESTDVKTKAFGRLFEQEGPGVVSQVVRYHSENAGVSRFDKFRYFYKEILKRPLEEETYQSLCRAFASLVVEEVIRVPYVSGAKEFLDANRDKYKCFICSATPQEELEFIVRKRGMAHYFRGVHGAPRKKQDIVREILLAEGLVATDAAYVGDAMSDYEAAVSNNITFIARLHEGDPLFDDKDCLKIMDLTGLDDILKKLAGNVNI